MISYDSLILIMVSLPQPFPLGAMLHLSVQFSLLYLTSHKTEATHQLGFKEFSRKKHFKQTMEETIFSQKETKISHAKQGKVPINKH